jgi:hypothetical protein
LGKATFAGTTGKEEDAPQAAVRETVVEPTVDLKRNFFTPRVGQVRTETVSVAKPASRPATRRSSMPDDW